MPEHGCAILRPAPTRNAATSFVGIMRPNSRLAPANRGGRRRVAPEGETAGAIAERASEALRLRHEAAVAEATRAQVARYVDAGHSALERQDYPGAANSYRIAASLAPDDAAVQATCNDALRQAAVALCG